MSTTRIVASRSAIVALCLAAGAAHGEPTRTFTQVVRSDHASASSSSWNGALDIFFPPAVNDHGDLTFQARTTTNRDGIWIAGGRSGGAFSVFRNTAQEGFSTPNLCLSSDDPAPPGRSTSVTFTGSTSGFNGHDGNGFVLGFGQPVINNNGMVAFLAAGEGESFPNVGGSAISTHFLLINDQLAVRAGESLPAFQEGESASSDVPYWLDLVGADGPPMRALTHIALPLDGPDIVSWYAKLSGTGTGGDDAKRGGVFFGKGRANECDINYARAARQTDIMIGESTVDNVFTHTSMATGPGVCRFAFGADHQNNGSMIGAVERDLGSDGPQWNIASTSVTAAPGAGTHPGGAPALFSQLKFPPGINNAGDIVFRAQTDLNDEWGIWRADLDAGAYTLSKVVYATDPVPGVATGVWERFGDPVVNAQGDMAFLARFTHEVSDGQGGVQDQTEDAIRRASPGGVPTHIVQTGQLAPKFDQSGFVGRYTGLGDPEFNGEGNIAFLADLDITDTTLRARLDVFDPTSVTEEGIFYTEPVGSVRSVVTSGMTLADLIGFPGDGRVIIDLKYAANGTGIDTLEPREGFASGHQDGRRAGMTARSTFVNGSNQNCTKLSIAFVAVFLDPVTLAQSQGVFIADIEDCTTGGGGGCTSCLCSTDPDCGFGELSLGAGPDFDQNGVVDDTDLGLMMLAWGHTQGRFDMNQDGMVNEKDLAMLVEDYGTTIDKESDETK